MPAHWFYINEAGTEPEGPHTLANLSIFFKQRQITGDTFVWHGRRVKEWTKIDQVPGLANRLNRSQPGHANQSSRGSVAELFSAGPRFNSVPGMQGMNTAMSEEIGGEPEPTPGKMRSMSVGIFRNQIQDDDRETLIAKLLKMKEENERLKEVSSSPVGANSPNNPKLVQVAQLLVKTQDELERKSKENDIILQENRNHKARMAELEQKLKKEMQIKNNLRKQWKKAQIGYEAEIKQYQSQLDIFFAAETELGNELSDGRSEIQLNLSFVE